MRATVNQESHFSFDEMFVSLTDPHGIILSGNEVFFRVSGYSREQLIGQPHNIIRHPDMPKAVFKLLWDTISSGQPIVAYVKNRNIEGKYYWVLALVLPTSKGYLSIRVKPSSALFPLVESLYQKMRSVEQKAGVEGSAAVLSEALVAHGFQDYPEFARAVLAQEVASRSEALFRLKLDKKINTGGTTQSPHLSIFLDIISLCENALNSFTQASKDFSKFQEIGKVLNEKTQAIIKACERLEYLSLNMSVTANKFGKEGASLATVANSFQRAAKEIADRFLGLGVDSKKVAEFVTRAISDIQMSQLQIEMLSFFVQESVNRLVIPGSNSAKIYEETLKDIVVLVGTVKGFFEQSLKHQSEGIQTLRVYGNLTESLKNVVMSLDLIRLGGRLEGARQVSTEEAFNPYVEETWVFLR
jgi:PAS domain S-box-containing protein